MKHAGADSLKTLFLLLRALRKRSLLVEKNPGTFYLKSKAFLHFHEDPSGMFADLKETPDGFKRYRVTTKIEQKEFLARVDRCLMKSRGQRSEVRGQRSDSEGSNPCYE